MTLYQKKYRIESTRLKHWDYRNDGAYFITICTQNKQHFFGEIHNHQIYPNLIGDLAQKYWHTIPEHFPYARLDAFVVMPNHIHGIVLLKNTPKQTRTITPDKNQTMANISPTSGSIASLVRSYKSVVSKHAHEQYPAFAWQARYHEHIIRNPDSFARIQYYIKTNPENWRKDTLYTP